MAEERKSGRNTLFMNLISLCFYSVHHSLVTTSALLYLTEHEAVQNSLHMEQEDICICMEAEQKICSPRGCGEYSYCTFTFLCWYSVGMGLYRKL